jgi:hypothetical protein
VFTALITNNTTKKSVFSQNTTPLEQTDYWSQSSDYRPSPEQTISKVKCKLLSQSQYFYLYSVQTNVRYYSTDTLSLSDLPFRFRLASLSTFVTDAINKYQLLQKKSNKKEMRRFSTNDNANSTLEQKTPKAELRAETKARK